MDSPFCRENGQGDLSPPYVSPWNSKNNTLTTQNDRPFSRCFCWCEDEIQNLESYTLGPRLPKHPPREEVSFGPQKPTDQTNTVKTENLRRYDWKTGVSQPWLQPTALMLSLRHVGSPIASIQLRLLPPPHHPAGLVWTSVSRSIGWWRYEYSKLIGWTNPSEKYNRQIWIISYPRIGGENFKNRRNHHRKGRFYLSLGLGFVICWNTISLCKNM